MFNNTPVIEPTLLDQAIERILKKMEDLELDSQEYKTLAERLAMLSECRPEIKPVPRISPDTVLTIVGNLAGIILILSFEKAHVVTSKALGFVLKARI